MPPNLPETVGMEEFKHEFRMIAVQTPKYQGPSDLPLTPPTHRKMNHTSKEIKCPSKKASIARKHRVLSISNAVI